jgi:hypothetical protein
LDIYSIINIFILKLEMMIVDQLLEIHEQLSDDEMWLTILDAAFEEAEVDNLDDLIDWASENEDEGILYNLVSEGDGILSLKDIDNYYDSDDYDDEY